VVSVELPGDTDGVKLAGSLNALTPEGIAVNQIQRVPRSFDARDSASSRTYRYYLSMERVPSPFWVRYCWQVGYRLDASLMESAAAATVGKHDFTGFTPAVTEHTYFRRTVRRCLWRRVTGEAGMLRLEIEADAFLRHMVRALVGTMVEVGGGRRDLAGYGDLLEGAHREASGITAPSHGLCLWDVRYGGAGSSQSHLASSRVAEGAEEEAME